MYEANIYKTYFSIRKISWWYIKKFIYFFIVINFLCNALNNKLTWCRWDILFIVGGIFDIQSPSTRTRKIVLQ